MATRVPDEAVPEGVANVLDDPTAQMDAVVPAPAATTPPPPAAPPTAPPPPPAPPAAPPAPPAPPVLAEPVAPAELPTPEFLTPEPVASTAHAGADAPVEALYTSATPPQQVVYVQAPVPPRAVGNRGVGSLLAIVAAIIYGVLLAAAEWVLQWATTGATGVEFLALWDFYIPVLVFAVALILLVLLVNRAGWGAYVFGSLFVGAAVYLGSIGIILLLNWLLFQEQSSFALFLASAFYIVAAVLAREVAVWFGWIIARRGRRVTARNAVAREELSTAA